MWFAVCMRKQCALHRDVKMGGRYETKKTRNKADVCQSHGGSYGIVGGGCERMGRDECEGVGDYGNYFARKCTSVSVCR